MGKTIRKEHTADGLTIFWQPIAKDGNGVRILRVFGNQPVLFLPKQIGGQDVTEIGAYCFSPSRPEFCKKDDQDFSEYGTELDGSFLLEVHLPDSVEVLHNAAFYNCRKLQTLSVGANIRAIGSDEFTNDTCLKTLILRSEDTVPTGLSLILERIAEEITVFFQPSRSFQDAQASHPDLERKFQTYSSFQDAQGVHPESERKFQAYGSFQNAQDVQGVLFFPEYYEWLDEISPAHIFSRSIHGEGFRMRKCFTDGILDYGKYDQCFSNALTTESPKTLCQIALTRLFWPSHLHSNARERYESVLKQFLYEAFALIITKEDFALLTFFCSSLHPDASSISEAIDLCLARNWSEGASYLIEEKHKAFSQKEFLFDLNW